MELKEIYALMDKFEKSSIYSLEVTQDKTEIKMKKTPVPAQATPFLGTPSPQQVMLAPEASAVEVVEEYSAADVVSSPVVGIFYTSSSPETPAFVQEGSRVKKGDVLGLIEAMKMFNDVVAPKDGVVEKVLAGNEELVEFGTALFVLKDADNV